jgi:hypothetical protein
MKKFNDLSLEQQLGLRIFNLEQTFGKDEVLKRLRWACNHTNFPAFADEFWQPNQFENRDMIYIQVVQIVNYFGKELTLRFLSFNFKDEMKGAI